QPPVPDPGSPTTGPQFPTADPQPPKTRSWGDIKLSNVIPNLNSIFDEKQVAQQADEPELLSGDEREAFSHEELLAQWHAFADKLKAGNKINLFTLMTANVPQLLPDCQIGVVVENAI